MRRFNLHTVVSAKEHSEHKAEDLMTTFEIKKKKETLKGIGEILFR